ncbi:scabin-related ADP-ribosyltransferase [Catenuloplanes japonicus]|uniref:scabin-related ADP-ribosyltransferase n=1 Tax=Catenuloplanes japonicus TaxID=33876 RepID=UPI0006908C5B|nr:hypothetical protein [Catenuloplanes japonicus]
MPRHPGGGDGGGGDGPDSPDGPDSSRRSPGGGPAGHPTSVPEGQRIAQSEANQGRGGRSSGGGGTDRPRATDDPLFAAANRDVDLSRITPPGHVWRTDNYPLIRVDRRGPDEIFEHGFQPKNADPETGNYDLDRHVSDAEDGPFVSTSYAHGPGAEAPAHWEYEINAPGGIDLERSPGVRENDGEGEVAFPGGVDRRFIRSAQLYDPFTNEPVGERRYNPHYEEWRTPDDPPG